MTITGQRETIGNSGDYGQAQHSRIHFSSGISCYVAVAICFYWRMETHFDSCSKFLGETRNLDFFLGNHIKSSKFQVYANNADFKRISRRQNYNIKHYFMS